MTDPKDHKISLLDQQLKRALAKINELDQRLRFLERENNRNKSNITQLTYKKG